MADQDHAVKVVVGQRTAFSAYGKVQSLSGQPIVEGEIIARHLDTVEQAAIQADGSFRVMGLQPGKTYAFSVSSPQVERLLSAETLIMIEKPTKDKSNVDVLDLVFTGI